MVAGGIQRSISRISRIHSECGVRFVNVSKVEAVCEMQMGLAEDPMIHKAERRKRDEMARFMGTLMKHY